MIKTGLPYSAENMSDIYDNGAEVDMSNLHFPPEVDTKDIIRTCYIYLRNTNFNNTKLDFSNCSKEFKFKFLYNYLFGDIVLEKQQLLDDWIYLLFLAVGLLQKGDYDLTEEEAREFIQQYQEDVKETLIFLSSTLIFILYKLDNNIVATKDIEPTDYEKFNANIYNLIKHKLFQHLILMVETSPKFYTKYFKQENNDLFDACSMTDYYNLVNTLFSQTKESFSKILDQIKIFEENTKCQ